MRSAKVFSALMGLAVWAGAQAWADQAADEKAIRDLAANYAAAWNKADAKAVSEFFAEDGQLTAPTGEVHKGRAEVQKAEAADLAGQYKGAKLASAVTSVSFSGAAAATAEGTWEITDITGPDGNKVSANGTWTSALVGKDGKWWLQDLKVTAAAPAGGTTTQPSGGTPR